MLLYKPKNRLRVLFILPPFLPTPPDGYGGIEAVAAALLPALHRAGVHLTVTAPEGSNLKVSELRTISEPLYSILATQYNVVGPKIELYVSKVMQIAWQQHFDVIHDFTGLFTMANSLAAPLPTGSFPPVIHTVHGPMPEFADNYLELIKYPNLTITGISKSQLSAAPMRVQLRSRVVYNCLDPAGYQLGKGGDRLLAMGRLNHDKGQDRLVRYCAEHGLGLDIAGPVAEMADREQILAEAALGESSKYWANPDFRLFVRETLPLIDGELIRFYGNAGGELKHRLLQEAAALVMPNRWAEPFGMVAIEAMASGTPVIACGGGALPELVRHGVTGYLAESFDEMTKYLNPSEIGKLYRTVCRSHVERNFSAASIAQNFIGLYQEVTKPAPVTSTLRLNLPTPNLRPRPAFYEKLPPARKRPPEGNLRT